MRQLMHSFVGYTPPAEILNAVQAGKITSFCLFRDKNVQNPAQLRELSLQLRQAAHKGGVLPPLIGIDQEGGQLMAITQGVTELPGNMALGATRSPELAEQAGYVLGRELLAMGINLNFAPCLDVNVNPANPVVGIRSFGDDPQLVAELGAAFIRGMEGQGVMSTVKHFPGHGDTATDTHSGDAHIPHSRLRLDEVELYPFRTMAQSGVSAIMTAHIIVDNLDPNHPATISRLILHDLLREEWGYQGLTMTDAMDMHAVAQFGPIPSVTQALQAGADVILLGHLQDQLGLMAHFATQEKPEAVARIQAAQKRWSTEPLGLEVVGCAEHQAIAQKIAEKAITLVKDGGQLPLQLDESDLVVVITPEPANLTPADTSSEVKIELANLLATRHRRVKHLELATHATDISDLVAQASEAEVVIVGTVNAVQDQRQIDLVQALIQRGKRPIVVALRIPYDVMGFPEVETYLCSYGIRRVSMEAVTKVLWGEIEAEGILPCEFALS